ncbi:MAG TPA: hypothetical protein VKA83_04015 [Methylomirabilota bacterium]|nr:hypothetical protein [Methylomirabilota bacterium]
MTATTRGTMIGLALLVAAAAGGSASEPPPLRGACYCRAGAALHCTANVSERDCRRQCDEALCDDWFWKERLPCWNWGYGG